MKSESPQLIHRALALVAGAIIIRVSKLMPEHAKEIREIVEHEFIALIRTLWDRDFVPRVWSNHVQKVLNGAAEARRKKSGPPPGQDHIQ